MFYPTEYDTQLLSFNSSTTSSEAASFWPALRWEILFDSILYPFPDKETGSGYKVKVEWRKKEGRKKTNWGRRREKGERRTEQEQKNISTETSPNAD